MGESELSEIEARAAATEDPCPIRCNHGREPADSCDTCNGDDVMALVAEVRRLRGLLVRLQLAGHDPAGSHCAFCGAREVYADAHAGEWMVPHDADCPAFTPDGRVK